MVRAISAAASSQLRSRARAPAARRRRAAREAPGRCTTAESAAVSAAASPGRHQQAGVRAHEIGDGAGGGAHDRQSARQRFGHRHPVAFVPRRQHEDVRGIVAARRAASRSSSPTNAMRASSPAAATCGAQGRHPRLVAVQAADAGEVPRRIGASPRARAPARRGLCAARRVATHSSSTASAASRCRANRAPAAPDRSPAR